MTPGYFTASGGIGSAWGAPVPAHVPEAGRAPPPGQDVERWARMTAERVRTWVVGGMLAFPPWLDNYTEETEAHRRAYRQMFAEPVVHAATMANVYSVAELEVQTHPQDPENPREQEAAEFVGHALRTVRGGVVGLVTALLTGALIDGWSLVEPVWEPVTEGKYRGKWAWRAVKAKDVRHLTPLVDGFLNVIGIRSQAGLLGLRVFDPADFLLYRNLSLFESPRGLSDYRAAYRAWWIMATAWRLRALGLERWSQPSLKGTYTDEGQHRQALEAALAGYQANTWLTVPLGCTVDAIDIANRGESDFKSAIADLREEMAIACSYATLTILTSAQTNPRGDSEVQKTTTQLKQWGLAANVGAVLTEQAAPPLTRLNYPGVPPCTVTLGAVDEGALSARLRNDTGLVKDLGLKLSRKESYRYYGRQQPAGPDDELGGPPAPPAKPPGGGNGTGNGAAGGPPAPPFAETFAEERGGEFKRGGGRVSGRGGTDKKGRVRLTKKNAAKMTPMERETYRITGYAAGLGYDPGHLTDEQAAHVAKVVGDREYAHYTPEKIKEIIGRSLPGDAPAGRPAEQPLSEFRHQDGNYYNVPQEHNPNPGDRVQGFYNGIPFGGTVDAIEHDRSGYGGPSRVHVKLSHPITVRPGDERSSVIITAERTGRGYEYGAGRGKLGFDPAADRPSFIARKVSTDDFAEKGGQFRKGGGRVAAGPHTETTKALLAAHPVPADRDTPEGARGWRRSVAAQAAHDVLHAGPVREVPPDPGNPVKAALHAAAVHDAAEFHRDMLQGPRADEVAAAHPQGKAAVDEARRVAGERHRRAAAQAGERLGDLARSLPAPADRPLARADLGKGHVIEPGQVDEALRPAVEHLAAKIPHATAGEAAVAVADTPEARKALLVLRQLGAVQPLGEGTAEARAARERVTGSLTDEGRRALAGGPGAGFVSAAGVSRGVIEDAPRTAIPGHDTFRNRVTPPERVPGVPKTKKARQELAKGLQAAHTEARNALVKKYGTSDVESAMAPEERALDSHLFFAAELVATGRGREGPTDLGPVGDEHYARHYRNAVRALDQLRQLAATPAGGTP
jgi:hypothetical protein